MTNFKTKIVNNISDKTFEILRIDEYNYAINPNPNRYLILHTTYFHCVSGLKWHNESGLKGVRG